MLELKEKLVELDLDVLTTFITTLAIIFFGVSQDVRDKAYQLKNVIIMYLILFLLTIWVVHPISVSIIFISIFFAGGLTLLNDKENDLEKELGFLRFFFYATVAWISLVKTYIWLLVGVATYIVSISIQNFGTILLKENHDYIITIIILLGTVFHYIRVSMDYYNFKNFKATKKTLFESSEPLEKNDLLSFVLFMEDRNLFNRRGTVFGLYDIKSSYYLNNSKPSFMSDIKLNDEPRKRFIRGYSTIEQQIFRNSALEDNSYRYFFRRKFFIENIYNVCFTRAILIRRSKSYGRKKNKQRQAYQNLIWSFKLNLLEYYFRVILKNPNNEEELFLIMSKNSRVTKQLYSKIYYRYIGTTEHFENLEKIKTIRNSTYNLS
ncbi:hypothetical protein EC604_15035 [Paenibacillus amylolyticus]|uniref:Uncharacterized protein n=1 Tax=Paenibacillus amylolyticus TaxID=1451 RepID=A0A5M9WUJ3_PAEAM|nr:hypothetical protein [Paenibacillus amylolyticus]KAA8785158.1 hypothetical protein EC604_15035 [Paenibacillus amylolyticus]